MKNVLLTMTTFLIGMFLAAGAFGGEMKTRSQAFLHSADEVIGTDVRDVNGKEIGEIEGIQIDMRHGMAYAVVEHDELTEIDNKLLVPLSAFRMSHDTDFVTLPIAEENLANYPKRDATLDSEAYGRSLHDFYGVTYPWGGHEIESHGRDITVPLGGK